MSFIKFVGKTLLVIVLLHASYVIFNTPAKTVKFVEERYQILHPYLLKHSKPYFQLPPQLDAKTNQLPFDTITYTFGFILGFFGVLLFLFNSRISARILSLVVLSFAIFIHNPDMHKQSIRHIESKEGLLDLGIAGGLLVFASYQSNKKNTQTKVEKKEQKKEEQNQSSEQSNAQEQKKNDKQSQGNKKKKQ